MFGEWIKQKRDEMGWSQSKLSQITGIKQSTISNWENGHANPSTLHLPKIAKVFSVKLSDIPFFD